MDGRCFLCLLVNRNTHSDSPETLDWKSDRNLIPVPPAKSNLQQFSAHFVLHIARKAGPTSGFALSVLTRIIT